MAERPSYPLSRCSVPGCRRWSKRFSSEWLCGEHWKLVDRTAKRFRTRRLRDVGRAVERYEARVLAAQALLPQGGPEDDVWKYAAKANGARRRWRRLERMTWERMKRQAIERAAGI